MPQPLKVFERPAAEHLAGCFGAAMALGTAGIITGCLLALLILVPFKDSPLWARLAIAAGGGVFLAFLAGSLAVRLLQRARDRVVFYEDRVDVRWRVTRLADIEDVRAVGGRVKMKDRWGRETWLPEVAAAGELLAWFKTRLPPDRILQ